MKIPGYHIDLDNAIYEIKKNDYKTIGIQLPEGLKSKLLEITDYIQTNTGCNIIVIADPCFGACDIPNSEMKNLGIELVLNIGHTKIPNITDNSYPILFINAFSKKNTRQIIEKAVLKLEGKNIGIVTTAQHLHEIEKISRILTKNKLKPIVSDGDNRITDKGQILGCNFSAATKLNDMVDSFLFIGSGNFHPIGLLISTKKPVIVADPYTNKVKKQEIEDLKDSILRQRYGSIAISKNAKKYGILIGKKRGQQRIKLAYRIKDIIESKKRQTIILLMDNFSYTYLEGFREIDCFVSTACPRIAIDDHLMYKVPILTPIELEISLGFRKWEDYKFDEIQ